MAKPSNDPILQAAEEAVRLSVSEQLDSLRLSRELSIERTAQAARMSPQAVLDLLKTSSDAKLSSLVRLGLIFGKRVRISFEPASSSTAVG